MEIRLDTRSLERNLKRFEEKQPKATDKGISDTAEEIMRLSQKEVPHDTGQLQNSGAVEKVANAHYKVGYNKVYASRLHEHPEYNFQKGRKGKYLEDPIKTNLRLLLNKLANELKESLL
jgi:septal ring factor EnvC (AmiA/AmiB activator)